jgi:hypothetical protein
LAVVHGNAAFRESPIEPGAATNTMAIVGRGWGEMLTMPIAAQSQYV